MVTGDEELMRKALTDRFKIVFLTKIKIIFNFFFNQNCLFCGCSVTKSCTSLATPWTV